MYLEDGISKVTSSLDQLGRDGEKKNVLSRLHND